MKKFFKWFGLGTLIGFLGAWGGADETSKAWRRIVIPILIMALAFLRLHHWSCILIMSMAWFLASGHGIPSAWDKGSTLGKFFFGLVSKFTQNLTKQRFLANFMTRGTNAMGCCISLLPIPILKGNWVIYGIGSVIIFFTFALISWRDLGVFYFKGKYLLWVDMICYSILGTVSIILIG